MTEPVAILKQLRKMRRDLELSQEAAERTTGQQIVDGIMAERRVGPKDFYSRCRFPHLVAARIAAIKALIAAGFNNACASRVMKCHQSTIGYWRHLERRRKMRAGNLAYYHTYVSPTRTTYL